MSRKRKKRKKRPQPPPKPADEGGGLGFVLGAVGFGLLCIAAGVLIVVLRVAYSRDGAEMTTKETGTIGYWLIALGVVAIGLTLVIRYSRRD